MPARVGGSILFAGKQRNHLLYAVVAVGIADSGRHESHPGPLMQVPQRQLINIAYIG
jgi:hypothetical protein